MIYDMYFFHVKENFSNILTLLGKQIPNPSTYFNSPSPKTDNDLKSFSPSTARYSIKSIFRKLSNPNKIKGILFSLKESFSLSLSYQYPWLA